MLSYCNKAVYGRWVDRCQHDASCGCRLLQECLDAPHLRLRLAAVAEALTNCRHSGHRRGSHALLPFCSW